MAFTVPRYEQSTVQTAPVAIPQAQAFGADAFGASLATGLNSAAHAAGYVAKQEQEKANLETAQNATIFFDQLAKNGDVQIKAAQGEDAFGTSENPSGITGKSLEDFDAAGSDWIQKNTSNSHQAKYAMNVLQERRNALEHTGLTHELDQKTKVQDSTFQASLSSTLDRIALYATDPAKQDEYQKAIDFGRDNIEAYANTRGWSQEQLDEKDQVFQEQAAKVKAVQMMHKNPIGAKTFIEENKETLGASYTELKQSVDLVSADQTGINAAEEISGRLYKEDYTDLRQELFKKFGGGTDAFDYRAFKVAEGQLAANNQAIVIAKKQNLEKLTVPIYQAILQTEKTGAKMSPQSLSQLPEYQDMITSDDPEVVKAAAGLMDKVYGEHHQEVAEARSVETAARAERRAARSEARFEASQAKQGRVEAQRDAWMELYQNPDQVAGMSQADVLKMAVSLGSYGPKLIEMHQKATSPAALAAVKVETSTFKSVMETLRVPKSEQGHVQEAMTAYLVHEQQRDKRVLNKDQIRSAIGAAIQDVQVNVRGSFLGFDTGTSTITKKLYEVENPAAIVIPPDAVKTITQGLKSYGIADTSQNRVKIYKSMLSDQGARSLRGIK